MGPLAATDSTTYGINYKSALNELDNFHVAGNQLPQDVMHILFEGVVPYEVKNMLIHFIHTKKYFDLEYLNAKILCFPYSRHEIGDKPTPIPQRFTAGNIHQSCTSIIVKKLRYYIH